MAQSPVSHLLETPIEFLKGVGPFRGECLTKELGIRRFGDLLDHFPFRYLDRSQVCFIRDINPMAEYVQVCGYITHFSELGEGRKKRLVAEFRDETGTMELVWFARIASIRKTLSLSTPYLAYGRLNTLGGQWSIAHPDLEIAGPHARSGTGLQPLYPSTEKLRSRQLTNQSIGKLTRQILDRITQADLPEWLPESLIQTYGLCSRYQAYHQIHFPKDQRELDAARHRLKFEELLLLQLQMAHMRAIRRRKPGWAFPKVGDYFHGFYRDRLPFSLTEAQKRVIREIREDCRYGHQMNRLVQGDVGSGKTVVALMSMLLALDNGFQACLMAPTEILAQQHYQSIKKMLGEGGPQTALLTGSVKGKERKRILDSLANGSLPLVIGTHALIEGKIQFHHLGLAVIDEQHRFGVGQRARLWEKNRHPPHILVMTATPIPRTLAMTQYGDLDFSLIDELPAGRKPIKTFWRPETHRSQFMDFLRKQVDQGRQAYIVYPLIEESEKMDFESLMAGYEQVRVFFSRDQYQVAMVHGRQPVEERQRNMERFQKGEAQILVATTVIEVGVDVPNATVMLIESAERFGLSQLHQLRGRVGRGGTQSYCLLLTGNRISAESRKRMEVLCATSDGFRIAEEDLAIRGPGDLHGTRQSGALTLKLADLVDDLPLMEITREAARKIMETDPGLILPTHQGIAWMIRAREGARPWGQIG